MFAENKYTRWYLALIDRARIRPKFKNGEWHHPIPKSLGGDLKDRVMLTPREHLICHMLLTRMLEGEARSKMCWALHRMLYSENKKMQRYKPSARTYEKFREMFYAQIRGKNRELTEDHRNNIVKANQARRGRTESEATRAKHRSNRTGTTLSETHKAAIAAAHLGKSMTTEHRNNIRLARKGKKNSEESKRKTSESLKGRVLSTVTKQKIAEKRRAYWEKRRAHFQS